MSEKTGEEGHGGGECVRVSEREGYPLHCCVTRNLIEQGREAGRQRGREKQEGAGKCKSCERGLSSLE